MSDLITTSQDTFRDKCIHAYVEMDSTLRELARRARDPKGQTAAEYMGILFVAAVLVAAVLASNADDKIKTAVSNIIGHISKAESPK